MAPPPGQSQLDVLSEFSRKEALAPAEHQQEHEKSRRDNLKSLVNPQIDIIEVGSASGSNCASLGKRSPEPEAREPLGGAELQRPPKFFHEDNGLKGLAGLPPAAVPYGEAKEEDGKVTLFLRFLKKGDKNPLPNHGSHFFKAGTTGPIQMDDTAYGHGLEKRGGECVPALEKRTEKTEDGAAVAAEVKPEVSEVTEKDWNDAIHGAVQWTFDNKIKPALEVPANAEQIEEISEGLAADLASTKCAEGEQCAPELELTEAEIAAQAEEMVKAYYAEHPEAKAEVFNALGELANEQRVTGSTTPMSQLVQEAATLNDAAGHLDTKRSVHEIVNEYGKGKNHWKPKKLELLEEARFDGYPSPPEIVIVEAKMQAAGDANLPHDRIENVKEEDRHVEDDEWTKKIEKHDENYGVPEKPSHDAPAPPTNAIPRHAKRAPIDFEDWKTDGQDEVDVKFSQRLGEVGSGKHHKDKDGHHHKGNKHHSKSHHASSTAHHSKGHHATSAAHSNAPAPTESIQTRSFSAPARAPGHALQTSRVGGYKFYQAAGGRPAAETAPATSIKGHMHGAIPTHTAAVSGKTTVASTQKHAQAMETGSVKHVKVDKLVSSTHAQATHAANVKAAGKALATADKYEHITNHREPVDDDYRAFDKFNAATLNSVGPDSSTAQLLAESEKAAVELNHGTAESNTDRKKEGSSGSKFGKRAEGKPDGHLGVVINPGNDFDVDKMTTSGKPRNKSWHRYQKNTEWNVKKAQEKDMYRVASEIGQENGHEAEVVSQQEPIICGHELAAIQASNGHDKGAGMWWGRVRHSFHNNKGSKLGEENEKARKGKQMKQMKNSSHHKPVFRQMGDNRAEHKGPKAKIWDGDNDKLEGIYMNLSDANNKEKKEEGSKLGKRHSHIPQVKEEEDAKMRGYASSRHLAGAAARKDRQKAAEKVNKIAKDLEEDREALHAAAEHRADRLMAQAEKEEKAAAKKGKGREYFDHDTYDPIKAHIAEDEEEMEEDDREGPWTDVYGGELLEHNHYDSGNKFAKYELGRASATGLPGVTGAIADKASEMSDLSMALVIGIWISILFAILKLARKKTEGETGWLKGRRPRSRRAEGGYLEDMEEGGVEKRHD